MTSESVTTLDAKSKEQFSSHLYFTSLYFVTVGALYLWGYWAPFGVNILEYLALADVFKASAYPIATVLMLLASGAVIGEVLVDRHDLPPGSGKDTRIGRFLNRFAPLLLILYASGTFALFFFGPVEKWTVLPVLLAFPLYVFLKRGNFLLNVIPNESARSVVVGVLAMLPAVAYGHGTLAANKILTAKKFTYVVSELPGYPAGTNAQTQLRLVGHAGEHMFFFDPVKDALVVAKIESDKALVLKRYMSKDTDTPAMPNPPLKRKDTSEPVPVPAIEH